MSVEYTYQVLKYVHDVAANEALNIGVVLYAPSGRFLRAMIDTHYERLSRAFADFNGDDYRLMLRRFQISIDDFRDQMLQGLKFGVVPQSIDDITRTIWADASLSFRLGPALSGITNYPEEELQAVFDRMVLSQYPRDERQRRTDEEVWSVYKPRLAEHAATSVLRPKTISTSDFDLTFEYAFANENWHALQPLSLDYSRSESIQRKSAQWLGNCTALQGQSELKMVYLLLGRPQLAAHKSAYEKAKNLLNRIPIDHEIVEEDAASDFASELATYMKKHRILT